MNKKRQYNLRLSNGLSEKWFIEQHGKGLFDSLSQTAFSIDAGRCSGCDHEPMVDKQKFLYFHIYNYNQEHPELTQGVTLCKACHLTQHIAHTVSTNWIKFVNSEYTQGNLVLLSRTQQLYEPIKKRSIVELPIIMDEFIQQIKNGEDVLTPTLKVIFTENFIFNDIN